MKSRTANLIAVFLVVVTAGGLLLAGPSGRPPVKIRLKRASGKTEPGQTALLALKLKNRTKEEQTVTVRFLYEESEDRFGEQAFTLAAKERRKVTVDCPVPADHFTKKLKVVAQIGEEVENGTKVRVGPLPETTIEQWRIGRDLYVAECASCHGTKGKDIRGEDFGEWREVLREGEDSMPAYPAITASETHWMREYLRKPNREPPAPATATWEGGVKALMDAHCVACHRLGNALDGFRFDTYPDSFKDRGPLVDSVVKNRMPPAGPLPKAVKDLLQAWLDAGAPEK